jgi:hypothetical protein
MTYALWIKPLTEGWHVELISTDTRLLTMKGRAIKPRPEHWKVIPVGQRPF